MTTQHLGGSNLTKDDIAKMVQRLREFLAAGGIEIKQTHAYEAIAQMLGHKNWNTLNAALKPPGMRVEG